MQLQRQAKSMAGGTARGGLVEIQKLDNLVIVSDLHGDLESLFRILDEIEYNKFLSNRLNKLVFLGDYVDRGSDSIGILYSVCYLKSRYPDSVLLMRGNHEAPAEFPFSPHDLPYNLIDRFGDDAKMIYGRILEFFKLTTLAMVIRNDLLLVHGGLPTEPEVPEDFRESISLAQENHIRSRVLEELLWNDPRPIVGKLGWDRSSRGIGRYFGSQITKRWLAATGTRTVVRGHEPCQGFRIDHDRMILTLFSSREAYPAFKAAYISVDGDSLAQIKDAEDLSKYVKFLG